MPSAYLDGPHYSYHTCGSENTFAEWFGGGAAEAYHLTGLIGTVEHYVKATSIAIESSRREFSGQGDLFCSAETTCPCTSCETADAWGGQSVDFHQTTALWRAGSASQCQPQQACAEMECLTAAIEATYDRVAALEYNNRTRVAYEYFGSQEIGGYAQWPGMEWCSESYDPRFRPWYSAAVTGPKDVVILVDVSGSMSSGRRIVMAQEAALKVLDTLTWTDYVTIIAFSSIARGPPMQAATDATKDFLRSWVDSNIMPSGGTNYRAAFELAYTRLTGSTSSGCQKVILFLTDGEPNEWDNTDFARLRDDYHAAQGITIFGYALGRYAPQLFHQLQHNLEEICVEN